MLATALVLGTRRDFAHKWLDWIDLLSDKFWEDALASRDSYELYPACMWAAEAARAISNQREGLLRGAILTALREKAGYSNRLAARERVVRVNRCE